MGASARRGTLTGRRREQEMLAGLLSAVRQGRSGVLVIRGEAGIGKSALLMDLTAQAADLRTIHISGAESEMELAYAGVHQSCTPLLGRLDRLPDPQKKAIQVALGLHAGDAPNGLLVGLAVLSLLGDAAAERPVICIVDDVQWIDSASLQTLVFVARRLLAEPVLMIFAGREHAAERELAGQPELNVGALTEPDARALLDATMPGRLDDHVRESILAEARGNPLALLELHDAVTPVELAGGYGLADAQPVAARVERTFGGRLRELPARTRTLLLIAAAEPAGEASWLWTAAERLGIDEEAATPAQTAGLITTDDRIRFRHPLVRSAVYRRASAAQRRQAHGALAEAITDRGAEDHRAWHRAHATGSPDEGVAAQLVRSAERARGRGGVAAAAAFLTFAVGLTPDPVERARRALDAAEAKLDAGDLETIARLLSIAAADAEEPLFLARIDLQRAKLAFATSRGSDAPPLLLAAARRLADLEPSLARDAYLEALMSAIIVGRLSAAADNSAMAVARAAREAPAAPDPPRAVDLLLDGLIVRFTDGYRPAAPLLKRAIQEFLREEEAGTADPRWHDITNRVLLDLFDPDTYDWLTARQLERLRTAGALTLIPVALTTRAGMRVTRGEFAESAALLEEAELINTAIGAPMQRYIEPYLAANRGQERLARDLVQASIDGANLRGEGFAISVALYAAAILHNGLRQYAEALAACRTAVQYEDFGMSGYVLAEMVEAATRCGETTVAADALAGLVAQTSASGTDTAMGLAARSRALVCDDHAAESEYRTAIGHLEVSPLVVDLARTHLVYGEWLRRTGRRIDARAQLRIAYDTFVRLGADAFAERAGRELEATGETVRKRAAGTVIELTAQESCVIRLARWGYTNAEIAAELFISPRTVEWHLSKIFAKLNITSRRELRNVAPDLVF